MDLLSRVLLILSILLSSAAAEDCQQREGCECVFPDGTGYDLKPIIAGGDILQAITNQNTTLDKMFFYHPCGDTTTMPILSINDTDNACRFGYSLCMYDIAKNKTVILGKSSDMKLKMNGDSLQVVFAKPETLNVSSVTFECTPRAKTSVFYAPLEKNDQVNLSLFSPYACPVDIDKKVNHGFFYTLFIVLLTLLFVYLFIGMLINYFLIGARGYELIPNYDFWRKVWRSIKLGFIYVKNGCRVIPAEDSYDAI